jgi:hypothetical protein
MYSNRSGFTLGIIVPHRFSSSGGRNPGDLPAFLSRLFISGPNVGKIPSNHTAWRMSKLDLDGGFIARYQ